MRAAVTGASGFIGNNLARRLLAEGHDVHLILRPGYITWRLAGLADQVSILEVDIQDAKNLCSGIKNIRPDCLFHFAAYGAYSWQTDFRQMVETNLIGTANLVEVCHAADVGAFINIGSSSEYGLKESAPAETEHLEPNSHYAITKAAATMHCHSHQPSTINHQPFHMVTLRPYSIYGPYEEPDRLIPTLLVHGLEDKLPPLVDPDIARDFVHVDDMVNACLLAANHHVECSRRGASGLPDQIYNVGTGVQASIRQIVKLVRDLLDISAEPEWGSMENRQWDTQCWVADSRKIQSLLGWKAEVSLKDGLLKTLEWLRGNPAMMEHYMMEHYRSR
ncbi:MAG: NAD-dependent epimerase/dehydratase family protein [Planctomycetota bacterium]|jgi:dolichol-phosphate mannosyltransferase|nr:NAD-dependent epimerase/dehydratase family protein [Planctomycetota bacterium]MDP7248058.1 NAD-dependent epimerase/dehydratase family protein [Planctomycetota bacterium]